MNNTSLGIVHLAFVALGSIAWIRVVLGRTHSDASGCFIVLCASNSLWAITSALFYLLADEKLALWIFDLRLVFMQISALAACLVAYKVTLRRPMEKRALITIFSLPLVQLIIVLTNPLHGLMRSEMTLDPTKDIRVVVVNNGVLFYIHCLLCCLTLAIAASMIIRQLRRMPKNYRPALFVLLSGLLLSFIIAIAVIFDCFIYFDPLPIVALLFQLLYYFALYRTHTVDSLFSARDSIFENIPHPILILDPGGMVVDYNNFAQGTARQVGIQRLYGQTPEYFLSQWLSHCDGRLFAEDNSIFTVFAEDTDAHYQVSSTPLFTEKGEVIGSYVEYKNITPIMSIIHKLQDTAYFDHLTGLYNRNSFALRLNELRQQQYLPLGIVVCDVNGLKLVNDQYGHSKGDQLLQTITVHMLEEAPETAFFARMGGDEFVGLVPNCKDDDMAAMVAKLERRCSNLEDPVFALASLAVGYRICTDLEQDIQALIHEADMDMYANKYDRRRR